MIGRPEAAIMRAVAAEARSNSKPRVVPGHASQIDVEAVGARRRFRHSRDAQARAAGLVGPGLRAHALVSRMARRKRL